MRKPYEAGGGDDDPGDTTNVPIRDCLTRFEYTPTGSETSVALAGGWDWTTKEPMTLSGDRYVLDKELPPGIHAQIAARQEATFANTTTDAKLPMRRHVERRGLIAVLRVFMRGTTCVRARV